MRKLKFLCKSDLQTKVLVIFQHYLSMFDMSSPSLSKTESPLNTLQEKMVTCTS